MVTQAWVGFMISLIIAVTAPIVTSLILARIRGIAARAQGKMVRVLEDIPNEDDRDRWQEELQRVLLEHEGRPIKQFRESKQLIKTAEELCRIYTPTTTSQHGLCGGSSIPVPVNHPAIAIANWDQEKLRTALKLLSYRERRVFELRYGLGGVRQHSPEEIGQIFNVTPSHVREIATDSLVKVAEGIKRL